MILTDFTIIQRDPDGFGRALFCGRLPEDKPDDYGVFARVLREDDSLTVMWWTECDIQPEEGTWSISLELPEGGLYRLEAIIRDGSHAFEWCRKIKCLYHIGVGDVYLLTGQSNMTGYARDTAYDPPVLGVHALGNDGKWCIATHPLADATECLFDFPEGGTGSSPALSFARRLSERTGLPIGILPAAIGGSPLSLWNPAEDGAGWRNALRRFEYAGKIRGILWFQGCSDATEELASTYYDRFCTSVELWRRDCEPYTAFGTLPVLTVQLNRWAGQNTPNYDTCWGIIRDAQRKAALELPDVYVIPSLDLGTSDGIHNNAGANVILGERLANTALACIYGKSGMTAPAVISAERADASHIRVHITPGYYVFPMDNRAWGMDVEDSSGLIGCIYAEAEKDALLISVEREFTLPAKFHYGWRTLPPAFVPRDVHGMPLLACYGIEITG